MNIAFTEISQDCSGKMVIKFDADRMEYVYVLISMVDGNAKSKNQEK